MYRIFLSCFFLFFCLELFSQYEIEDSIITFGCVDKRFSSFQTKNSPIDTNHLNKSYYYYEYKNNRRLEKLYLNDSLWIDSIHRFYENGNLAFVGYNLRYNLWETLNPAQSYPHSICTKSYYENGKLKEYYVFDVLSNGRRMEIKRIYDIESVLFFEETILYGDTINGSFTDYRVYQKNRINCNKYFVYKDGKIVEVWYINKMNDNLPFIVEINIIKDDKIIILTKKKDIKRKLIQTPLFILGCNLYISNGPGRTFPKYVKPDLF